LLFAGTVSCSRDPFYLLNHLQQSPQGSFISRKSRVTVRERTAEPRRRPSPERARELAAQRMNAITAAANPAHTTRHDQTTGDLSCRRARGDGGAASARAPHDSWQVPTRLVDVVVVRSKATSARQARAADVRGSRRCSDRPPVHGRRLPLVGEVVPPPATGPPHSLGWL
jgi:hypothetical protein